LACFAKRIYLNKKKTDTDACNIKRIRNGVFVGVIILCLMGSRFLIGSSTDYMIYNYIKDGHLADFREQMNEQINILYDDSVQDVVLKPISDEQGPYMYMPATTDPDNYTNMVLKVYYEKNSVVVE